MADSLRLRVLTALLLAPLAIAGVLWLSTPWLAAGLGLVCLCGVYEWTRLIGLRGLAAPLALVAAAAAAMAAAGLWREAGGLRWATWVGVAWWPLAALWMRHYAFCEAPVARNHAASRRSPACWWWFRPGRRRGPHGQAAHGHGWLLFVVLLVWCADVCAYFAGRRYGKARLAPRISPGKTLAGVYGALLGSIAFAVAAGTLLGARGGGLAALVALALVTVGVSIVRDLYESLIKRHSQVKDSGNAVPRPRRRVRPLRQPVRGPAGLRGGQVAAGALRVRKRVALLGATGSIGASTADVLLRHPQRFEAVALSADRDVAGLVARCRALSRRASRRRRTP